MLCQNCGRRSSDRKSFCEHCGAIASEEVPTAAPRSTFDTKRTTAAPRSQARTMAQQGSSAGRSPSRPVRGGSSAIPTLIFWGLVAYGGYWLMSEDGRDLRTLLNDLIEQQRQQLSEPAPAPAPRTSSPPPAAPVERSEPAQAPRPAASPAPARGTTRAPAAASPSPSPARESAPALQPQGTAPPAADPGVEGLSPAQVIQKLGRPATVVNVNGVTGWSYRDGALIVFFVKDRATVKPPR